MLTLRWREKFSMHAIGSHLTYHVTTLACKRHKQLPPTLPWFWSYVPDIFILPWWCEQWWSSRENKLQQEQKDSWLLILLGGHVTPSHDEKFVEVLGQDHLFFQQAFQLTEAWQKTKFLSLRKHFNQSQHSTAILTAMLYRYGLKGMFLEGWDKCHAVVCKQCAGTAEGIQMVLTLGSSGSCDLPDGWPAPLPTSRIGHAVASTSQSTVGNFCMNFKILSEIYPYFISILSRWIELLKKSGFNLNKVNCVKTSG